MNVLSLFDGISCGMIALDRMGVKINKYYASEIDKYAISVSQHNWKNIIHCGDVTTLNPNLIEKPDLLIGGSPCQGFSISGKRLNFSDERSRLFFEYVRLLKSIKPRYFLLENVVMSKNIQDAISEILECQPIMINSSTLSAQSRKRLYWTNIPQTHRPKDKGISVSDILLPWDSVPENFHFSEIQLNRIVPPSDEISDGFVRVSKKSPMKTSKKSICLMARDFKGLPGRDYFNAVKKGEKIRRLTPTEYERLQTINDGYTSCVSNTQAYKALGNGWTVDVICHLLEGALISP